MRNKICLFFLIFSFFYLNQIHAQAFKRLGIGEIAPDITLKDINEVSQTNTKFKDKNVYTLIFFKNPSLRGVKALAYWQKLYESYQVINNFEIIAVYCPQTQNNVTQEELKDLKKIIEENKITFPVLIDEGLKLFGQIGVITMPSSAILDKNGTVTYILPGFPEFGAERDVRINLKKALGIQEEIIAKKEEYIPKNKADFSYKLALVVLERGNTSKSIEHLQTALTKDPDYALAHSTLGKVYLQEGKKNEAIDEFRKALTIEPDNVDTLLNYGFLCMDMDKKDDALLQFKNIIELDKNKSAEGFYGIGSIYVKNQIFDSAKIKIEEAIKLYTGWKDFTVEEKVHFAMSYFNLAEVYSNNKDNKNAIENYKRSYTIYKELTDNLLKERKNRAN